MIEENDFQVGIFIGGMEGIFEEFELFSKAHKDALILPVASTGGASKILFDKTPHNYDKRLEADYAYMTLFRELLKNTI